MLNYITPHSAGIFKRNFQKAKHLSVNCMNLWLMVHILP